MHAVLLKDRDPVRQLITVCPSMACSPMMEGINATAELTLSPPLGVGLLGAGLLGGACFCWGSGFLSSFGFSSFWGLSSLLGFSSFSGFSSFASCRATCSERWFTAGEKCGP